MTERVVGKDFALWMCALCLFLGVVIGVAIAVSEVKRVQGAKESSSTASLSPHSTRDIGQIDCR